MASSEFPHGALTNTYILHDFAEIAYIVCTAAIPANADRDVSPQDISSKKQLLARLRTAERQFRQNSILVTLDPAKLELFTFYKKADILKDQQTVLRKFGGICTANACKIAYKNACRIIDLMKPELARIYGLFSDAVISSLKIQALNGTKAINIGPTVFLVPSQTGSSAYETLYRRPQIQWHLQKIEIQIVLTGQLLLAARSSLWPTLAAMSDLIDPDMPPVDKGATLYLAPAGQLARYRGKWHTVPLGEQDSLLSNFDDPSTVKHRHRWFDMAGKWLDQNSDSSAYSEPGTIWLEIEIPVHSHPESKSYSAPTLVWKTAFWPAMLSYVFFEEPIPMDKPKAGPDFIKLAMEWYTTGASEARQQQSSFKDSVIETLDRDNNHFFDDEPNFGSPQQFMSHQMQAFAQSQTIYPTPPEGVNTQPTPGFSVDGTAQTPLPSSQHQTGYHSSPLVSMTDMNVAPMQEPAISNFLKHDADEDGDDLFDAMEDSDLEQHAETEEPNWDFFGPENLEPQSLDEIEAEVSQKHVHGDVEMEEHIETDMNEALQERENDLYMVELPQDDSGPKQAIPLHIERHLDEISQASLSPAPAQPVFGARTAGGKEDVAGFGESDANRQQDRNLANKRTRSSAYEIVPAANSRRDEKYASDGKYYFELKSPGATIHVHSTRIPPVHPGPLGSASPASSDFPSDVEEDRQEQLKPWARYDPVIVTVDENTDEIDEHEASIHDTDIESMLEVITQGPHLEPFSIDMPRPRPDSPSLEVNPERHSMVVQVLIEQLAQSSLLRSSKSLALPKNTQSPSINISFDNGGQSPNLTSASLSDLSAIQLSSSTANSTSRIQMLPHTKLRLKQADTDIAAELPITKFWETLSLQPMHGAKDLLALCFCPAGDNYAEGCETFLQRMGETWSSCNLGIHRRASLKGISPDGIVCWSSAPKLFSLCRKVANALANLEVQEDCKVIYMVLPDDDLSESTGLCNAFVEIYEALRDIEQLNVGDIVLQLVPASFIIDKDTLAVQPEEQFVELALEVYQRVPPLIDPPEAGLCAAAVTLDETLGPNLQFEMSASHTSPLLRHGECCHLAYCLSADRKWLCATWSDTTGRIALSMSYCLFEEQDTPKRPRSEILQNICDTSVQLMTRQKRKWWLAVAKVGLMDREELQDWMSLSSQICDENQMLSRVVLLNVEPQARLTTHGSAGLKQSQGANQNAANSLSTPVSTPQGINMSPEQTVPPTPTASSGFGTTAQTPPELNAEGAGENEMMLSDPLEDTWLVTFAFGLNQSHNFLEVRPAMASGFLLKKSTPQGNTGSNLAMLGVNLLAVFRKTSALATTPQGGEQLLHEILSQYRGLHTLALARKCVDPHDNCVPWHVAVAYKAARVLEALA